MQNRSTLSSTTSAPLPPTRLKKFAQRLSVQNLRSEQEEGGERSVEDGDAHAETVLQEFGPVGHLVPIPGERDPATESQFEYGARVAIWRLMKLFKKHELRRLSHFSSPWAA